MGFEDIQGAFEEEAVEVGGFAEALVAAVAEAFFDVGGQGLDLHVGRIADDGVEADEGAFVVEHFGKFKAPFEGVFENAVAADGFDLVVELLNVGGEFFDLFVPGGFFFFDLFKQLGLQGEFVELSGELVLSAHPGIVGVDFGLEVAFDVDLIKRMAGFFDRITG